MPDTSERNDGSHEPSISDVARRAAVRHPGLELLVLHGSRGRGDAREDSDWDFGFVGSPSFDRLDLLSELTQALSTDRVDLADLERAGGLLRFRAARDGTPVYERDPGAFERYWLGAVRFWLDAEPTLDKAYDDLLDSLGR